MFLYQRGISSDVENSSDVDHLPVIVSVNGGYMEHDCAPEKPDFTQ